jgi:pSer/pThr/pTyr-binding forkhead associated (FHA) protein
MAQVSKSTPDQVILAQGSTTIGRAKNNSMVIPFKTISLYHAKIMTFGNSAYIQDLDSTNGVFVNGMPKQFQVLHHGDSVNIGEYKFIVAGFEQKKPRACPPNSSTDQGLISIMPLLSANASKHPA